MKSLLILGRQPALGLAELEALYGAETITVIGRGGTLLGLEPADIAFDRLGGSIKLAKVLHVLDSTKWRDIEAYLSKTIPEHLQYVPEGKFRLGLSAYGLKVSHTDINVTGLRLKKIIKTEGRSVRIVPNKAPELNSAQVLHNQLTGPTGWELVLARWGDKTVLAQTVAEQDIEAYAARDQGRPMRDAKVGMLPPKLAQIIINLTNPTPGGIVLDPFCGTGVLLQEALLMGFGIYGSDLEPRMIDYTRQNIEWLKTREPWLAKNIDTHGSTHVFLEVQDAKTFKNHDIIDAVACETYLGKPLTSLPPRQVLDKIMAECDEIHQKFLRSLSSEIPSGLKLCLAVPAWKTKSGFLHLKTLDHLEEIGYNRLKFVHARNENLIYHREDQVVARELVILEKK